MATQTGDNFSDGIFWELYKDLERQFQDFLGYVPYLDGNENVYSYRLLNLILGIGGHVDSAFKEMARYPAFSNNSYCKEILELLKKGKIVPITLPLKAFETEYKLSQKVVIFKRLPDREEVIPFKPRSARTQSPNWWKIYNGIKHDVGVNIKEANLQNIRDALAGAFLLNVIHKPSILRLYDHNILKTRIPFTSRPGKYTLTDVPRHILQDIVERNQRFSGDVETSLFKYDYDQ